MNRNQESALAASAPAGHSASEGRGDPLRRRAECTCGWRQSFPRQGRNGLAVTSMIHRAIREHYEAAR